MKLFLIRRVRLTFIYVVLAYLFMLVPKMYVGTAITLPVFLGATLAVVLSTVLFIVLPTLGMIWMFNRIATRQGVKIEYVAFALYNLRWDFNRVAYDMNFNRDINNTIGEYMKRDKSKWFDRLVDKLFP